MKKTTIIVLMCGLLFAACQRQTVIIQPVPYPYGMEINKPSVPDTTKIY